MDASGQFPVTPALIVALGVGFAFFNEVLFWTLALLLTRDHRAETALQFACVSAGLGVLVWAAAVRACGARRSAAGPMRWWRWPRWESSQPRCSPALRWVRGGGQCGAGALAGARLGQA